MMRCPSWSMTVLSMVRKQQPANPNLVYEIDPCLTRPSEVSRKLTCAHPSTVGLGATSAGVIDQIKTPNGSP